MSAQAPTPGTPPHSHTPDSSAALRPLPIAEIRSRFLAYFERQGHTIVESSSLVPANDPTLLFTNAGMVQFKDVFLGKDQRPYRRAVSAQKCVRAGGKHNDLENVGFTARHHTFFEMLGNFSFGDYFKREAIHFAWEFVTVELGLPKDRLYVTVFEQDDEAAAIWHEQESVPKDRIYRFGEKDNFWSMGDTGPCGPCSEIFIDRGSRYSCGKPTCGMGCDCDRFMEFWNLVFMQFDRSADGKLTPLPKPSVDTGAGLERIASILQNVDTNYDTDGFQSIIAATAELVQKVGGPVYSPSSPLAVSYRVIADHSRAIAFLIGDGVMPSNEGRGYVLRRILRRAIRHGKKLGFSAPFLHRTCGFVIDQMREAYPSLVQQRALIERAVLAEEEQFFKTLERGLQLLDEEAQRIGSRRELAGEVAFKLYDTYGFPLDLTRTILAERGLGVDEAGFERSMERQRSESRKHWKGSGDQALDAQYLARAQALKQAGQLPRFVGYERTAAAGECVALWKSLPTGELVAIESYETPAAIAGSDDPNQGVRVEAVFSTTPFYAESGGQVADQGRVSGVGFEAEVVDVQKPADSLIVATLKPKRGAIRLGVTYEQETDRELRALTARNHTATHLLHWALRETLGTHVKQAGSLVSSELLRFDFSHFAPLSEAELTRIEDLINARIWGAEPVLKREMKKDQALALGAIAMFGEKYGEDVRVVSVGDFSTEFCGGTHVESAGEISLFKIVSEAGIAAGVRRIIALTSKRAFEALRGREEDLKRLRDLLKAGSIDEVQPRVERLQASERDLKRKLETALAKSAGGEVDQLLAGAQSAQGLRLVAAEIDGGSDGEATARLRDLGERLKQKAPDALIVLGVRSGPGKVGLLVASGPQAVGRFAANQVLQRLAPLVGGRGGGKPEMAQAGGTDPEGLSRALAAAREFFLGK